VGDLDTYQMKADWNESSHCSHLDSIVSSLGPLVPKDGGT
jgi:hypothetical protein